MDLAELRYRRAWARIAGLMYWLVFLFDFSGMTLRRSPAGHWLSLIGGLLTIPLAYGLYAAVAPVQKTISATAFAFRLFEIALTLISVAFGFATIRAAWPDSPLLQLAHWDHSTSFSAFVFTIGSTLFFLLFFRSHIIPVAYSALGIFASLVAFAACLVHLVHPAFPAMTMWAWIPMIFAELGTGAWLLFRSVDYSSSPAALTSVRLRSGV